MFIFRNVSMFDVSIGILGMFMNFLVLVPDLWYIYDSIRHLQHITMSYHKPVLAGVTNNT